ncbi:hypothetical protein CITRIK5_70257 [Citricoccus sp. K5]|nr:hypothetical protein CITRIK5_70257 [Citricoccus sp. K5]
MSSVPGRLGPAATAWIAGMAAAAIGEATRGVQDSIEARRVARAGGLAAAAPPHGVRRLIDHLPPPRTAGERLGLVGQVLEVHGLLFVALCWDLIGQSETPGYRLRRGIAFAGPGVPVITRTFITRTMMRCFQHRKRTCARTPHCL